MRNRSFLGFITVIYDVCRFVFLAALLCIAVFNPKVDTMQFSTMRIETIPLPLFIVPLTLFPIMAFFIWREAAGSGNFIRLYTAGKVLSIVTAVMWTYHHISLKGLFLIARFAGGAQFFVSALAPLLIVLDALSIAAVWAAGDKES
ncbi:MAG: hypothetical protein LBD22_04155 [Spirochaetaceae bacterium]|jgi:hypothetical protein|nr:hypothetical protein [Spirochaetaceae bacterium]